MYCWQASGGSLHLPSPSLPVPLLSFLSFFGSSSSHCRPFSVPLAGTSLGWPPDVLSPSPSIPTPLLSYPLFPSLFILLCWFDPSTLWYGGVLNRIASRLVWVLAPLQLIFPILYYRIYFSFRKCFEKFNY